MPRFALLEHRWEGVHWDFLLERGDGQGLRTWAIDEPLAPDKILAARALPDHRLAYLDYEGAISGGRGSVRRIDRGAFQAEVWEADRVVVWLAGDQLVGRVALTEVRDAGKPGASVPPGLSWNFLLKTGNFD